MLLGLLMSGFAMVTDAACCYDMHDIQINLNLKNYSTDFIKS